MQKSYWEQQCSEKLYPPLSANIETEVAIIGGGLAGLMQAYEAASRGHKVCILEQDRVGSGETAGSTAMLTVAHDAVYHKIMQKHGLEKAVRYYRYACLGVDKIRAVIEKHGIDCGWQPCDMVLFARTKKGAKTLVREAEAYRKMGAEAELVSETELPFQISAGLKIKGQGRLDPIRFVRALARVLETMGVSIFERSRVYKEPENGVLHAAGFRVQFRDLIVATHFPFINSPGFYFAKMYQHRSYNVLFSGGMQFENMYEGIEDTTFEYREADGYTLCGGADIRTGKMEEDGQYAQVEKHIRETFGDEVKIISRFSAQDCMTLDEMPFVGRYHPKLKNIYVVSGFNKWGFSKAGAAAEIIADWMEGKEETLFSPQRKYLLKSPIKAMQNFAEEAMGFGIRLFAQHKKIAQIGLGSAQILRIRGRRVGVYKHSDGSIHAVHAVCPHLGCGLQWNADEKSWDCPCHGSRFDIEGNLISNPSVKNVEKETFD